MPVSRRPTPPPEAIKQPNTVMDSLNAWADPDHDDDPDAGKRRVPLGYTPLAQQDAGVAVGWRQIFDSESDSFNFAIGMVIIVNAIVIGLETDMGRSKFIICEHVFNTCFVLEMFTRILQIGCDYFTSAKYLFDCTLVVTGTLDLWILPAIQGQEAGHSTGVGYQFSVMRLLRILRLMRVLRVIRLFRMFGQLLLIITAFGKALQVVLLLSVLVVIMIYALAIVATQMIGHNSDKWGENKEDLEYWFGTISSSMATLFWVMFGAGWEQLLHILTQVYPTALVLAAFSAYMVVTVSMGALIIGLISESLISAQSQFKQVKMELFAGKKKILAAEYSEELNALLEDDMDEFGTVEAKELKSSVKGDTNLTAKLMAVGVALKPDGLVGLVDSMSKAGSDRVSIEHFIEKVTNLSGSASASAVVDVKYQIIQNRQQMDRIEGKLDELLAKK